MNWTELNCTVKDWLNLNCELLLCCTEPNCLNWTARMCELLMWTGFGLNCKLLVEKHKKVIFCGEENIQKLIWGILSFDFTRTAAWVQTQNLENELRYVKFGIDEKKRWTDLKKVWFSWTEVIFETVHRSVQFSVHLNCSKVQQFRTIRI